MRYKILDQKGLNYITITVVDWIDLFTRKAICEIVTNSLVHCRKEKGLKIFGYVIMSSHLHLIVRAAEKQPLSTIIRDFKSYTARQIIQFLEEKEKKDSRKEWLLNHFRIAAKLEGKNKNHKVWKNGNHPIELYSPKVIRQKLDYIHKNPVVAGIVALPEHYLLSSASNYQKTHLPEQQTNCVLEIDLFEGIWVDEGFVFMGK